MSTKPPGKFRNTPKKTPLPELFEEYQSLPEQCSTVDYSSEESLKAYNKAVRRMHRLAERMAKDYDLKGAHNMARLLTVPEHNTHLWAARHLLEYFDVDEEVGEKALALLEEAAKGETMEAIEIRTWLGKQYGV